MNGVKKLKSGRYQARYFAGYDAKGKRVYPSKTFGLYGDAVKWRNARVREKDLGQEVESFTTLTVSEYLDQWLAIKDKTLRTNSIKNYHGAVNQYIRPYLGDVPLRRLKPDHLEQWQAGLIDKELSNSTVRVVRAVFNVALTKAVKLRLIYANPLLATDPPRKEKPQVQSFDREQAKQFIAACEGQRWGLSYKVSLATGIRPEEMFGLKWSALELDGQRGICHVREAVVRITGGGWQFEPPKSENSYRSIVFSQSLAHELKSHRIAQLEERMAIGTAWHDHDLVFTSIIGTPPNQADHSAQFKVILKRAGLPDKFRLYDLRHTFATLSLLAGVDAKTVSTELGHASVAFTLDTYAHVLREMAEGASDKRELLMKRKS